MTHTAKNVKNPNYLEMGTGIAYNIELPQGFSKGQNREWLKIFIETILIREGAVLNYKIVSAPGGQKNNLYIMVRRFEENPDIGIEGSSFSFNEESTQQSKQKPLRSKKKIIIKYLRYFIAYCVAAPFLILGFLLDKEKVGGFISAVTAICLFALFSNIVRKVWMFFGGDYGNLPGWFNYIIW